MPLYSAGKDGNGGLDGFKLRALFAVPHADDRTFFYGANFEFSINAEHWDENRFTSEIRPIIGWHLEAWDLIVNPILDTAYDGLKNLDFAPATRVAYNLSKKWAVAAEEYADFGPLHDFYSASQQSHQLYGVVNHAAKWFDIEAGVGVGLTSATDKLTLEADPVARPQLTTRQPSALRERAMPGSAPWSSGRTTVIRIATIAQQTAM